MPERCNRPSSRHAVGARVIARVVVCRVLACGRGIPAWCRVLDGFRADFSHNVRPPFDLSRLTQIGCLLPGIRPRKGRRAGFVAPTPPTLTARTLLVCGSDSRMFCGTRSCSWLRECNRTSDIRPAVTPVPGGLYARSGRHPTRFARVSLLFPTPPAPATPDPHVPRHARYGSRGMPRAAGSASAFGTRIASEGLRPARPPDAVKRIGQDEAAPYEYRLVCGRTISTQNGALYWL